jgi:hypothetical protein
MKKKISKILFATILFVSVTVLFIFASCEKNEVPGTLDKEYPADVAIAWIDMQRKLFVGTPGILPHVAGRTNAYVGLTLYESIVPGMEGYQSIAPQLDGGLTLPTIQEDAQYYWPASANAALAFMLKNLLPHTTPELLKSIDSLEADFYAKFQADADAETVQQSANFGKQIAMAIFEWSKTDGGHEAYKNPFSDTYVPPIGPGQWESTGEFPFDQPVYPYWGDHRTFIPGLADATQPPPPPAYSEEPGSDFYNAVNEIYTLSLNLSHEDSLTAKFWAYELLNPNEVRVHDDVSHAANFVTQMIALKDLSLPEAVVLYCKHSMAVNEAGISSVKAKFHYNLVRPITYIRKVLGHPEWKPVVPTPPFPEYTSAHAVISRASAAVFEDAFGQNFSFTDHSFDDTYGPRHFDSFEACAKEAALSRLQAGIHYRFAMDEGLKQGIKVAAMVNQLKFKK